MRDRVAEMKRRLNIDEDGHALREIERSDDAHDRAVRSLFRADWRDPTGYGIVLNTGRMSVDMASELLLSLTRSPSLAETPASRAVLEDKLLLARVRSALGDSGNAESLAGGLDMSVAGGVITLTGVATRDIDLDETMSTLNGVQGVKRVQNDIQLVPFAYGP